MFSFLYYYLKELFDELNLDKQEIILYNLFIGFVLVSTVFIAYIIMYFQGSL